MTGPFKMKGYTYPGISPVKKKPSEQELFAAANDPAHPMSKANQGTDAYYAWQQGLKIAPPRYHGAGGNVVDEEGNIIKNIAKT